MRVFPGGAVLKAPCFHGKKWQFDPWSGNKNSHVWKKKRKSWDLSCRSVPFLFLCIDFQCLPFRSVCMSVSLKVPFSFDFQEASTHQKTHNASDFRKQFPAPINKTFWADLTHCEFMGNTNTAFRSLFLMEFCSELYYVRIFNEKCILLLWCIEIHGFLRG